MSLSQQLKPHVEDLKTKGKRVTDMSSTERRLNFMTAVIVNPKLTKETKDKILRKIVAESQIEKALKDRGITIKHGSGPEVKIQRHDHK
jgi:site-specific recombinase